MKTLVQYISEQLINEVRQIKLAGDTRFGQFVITAGGAGSGKGYAQNFINADFKVLDVDKLKVLYAKSYPNPKDPDRNVDDGKKLIVNGWDFSNHNMVSALHELVKRTGWKKIQQRIAKLSGASASDGRLPNILLDITGKDKEDFVEGLTLAAEGYNKTLIWVVQSVDVAITQNATRARRVPHEVLLDTHNKSYKAVLDYILNEQEIQFDHVFVYFGFNKSLVDVKPDEVKNRVFELRKDGNKFVLDPELLDKINEYRERKVKSKYDR